MARAGFLVLRDPGDMTLYAYDISGVYRTHGSIGMLLSLQENADKGRKGLVVSWLCHSVVCGYRCRLGVHCSNVHVTPRGQAERRVWLKRKVPGERKKKETVSVTASTPDLDSIVPLWDRLIVTRKRVQCGR